MMPRLTLLAAAVMAANGALAQEAPITKVEVKGAADNYDARRDDTASKIIVKSDEIVKYGDQTVLDVLKRLPGVTVSGSSVRMRGLGGYTQFLVNGERPPAGFSLDALAPDAIERIEVVRAATAEYSTQSIAGTINVILKKSVVTASHELKGGLGGAKGYLSPGMIFSMSDKKDKTSYTANGSFAGSRFEQDSVGSESAWLPNGVQTVARTSTNHALSYFRGINGGIRLNWTLENGDTLGWQSWLNGFRGDDRNETRGADTIGGPAAQPNINSQSDNQNLSARTELNWVAKLPGSAKLDSKVSFSGSSSTTNAHNIGFSMAGAITENQTLRRDSRDHGFTSTGKYTRPLLEGHAMATGWDAGYTRLNTENELRDTVLPPIPGLDPLQAYHATVKRLAVFAQDEWNVTPRFSVYLGGRWEGIRTQSSGTGFDPVTSDTSVLSPLLQTLWKLPDSKADQLRFALTRTYRAPGTSSLVPRRNLSPNNERTSPDYQGNPQLKPELALGLDLTLEHYFAEGGLLSATVSTRRISNYIHNKVDQIGTRWVSMPQNVGFAETHGLELEAKYPFKSGLDVRASLSRNWSSVDNVPGPDNRLDSQTPVSANLGFDYKQGQLTTGASYNFSNGGLVRTSATEFSYQSVRRNLDIYALWKFSPKLQLRYALMNILHQDTFSESGYESAAGTYRRYSQAPGLVRWRVLLESKF